MYPILRLFLELRRARRQPALPLDGTHVTRLRCLPQDIDVWRELNNGRTLSLCDIGRVGLGARVGLIPVLRRNRWGMVVAGASTRYRRRITLFEVIEIRTRLAGWDARFLYLEQSLWVAGAAAGQALIRAAVTSREGIVAPERLASQLGAPASPDLPDWISAWVAAEQERPWPPR